MFHKYDRVIKHTFNSLPENISIWFDINQLSKMYLYNDSQTKFPTLHTCLFNNSFVNKNMCKHWMIQSLHQLSMFGTWSKDKLINCIENIDTYFTNSEFSTFNRNVIFITIILESRNEFQKYVSYNYDHFLNPYSTYFVPTYKNKKKKASK